MFPWLLFHVLDLLLGDAAWLHLPELAAHMATYAAYRPHASRGFRLAWAGKTLTARPHRTLGPPQCEILSPNFSTPPQTSCQSHLVDRQLPCSAVSTARSRGSSSCAHVCREAGLHVLGPPCMAAQRTGPPPCPGDEPPGAKQGQHGQGRCAAQWGQRESLTGTARPRKNRRFLNEGL